MRHINIGTQQVLLLLWLIACQALCSTCIDSTNILLSRFQQPIVCELILECNSVTKVTFYIDNLPTGQQTELMLRLDYEPNKCVFAKQDIHVRQQNPKIQVQFIKSCCNLYTNNNNEVLKVVSTLRKAYVIFSFPISKVFADNLLPLVILTIAGAALWTYLTQKRENGWEREDKKIN